MKLLVIIFTLISCGKPRLPGSRTKSYVAQEAVFSNKVEVTDPVGYYPQVVNTPSTVLEKPAVKAPSVTRPTPNPGVTKPQPIDGNYEVDIGGLYGASVYIPRANKKFPVIIWGNGCKAGSQKYRSMLKTVAKQGYVVVQSAAELSNKNVSNCEAYSDFYTPLTKLASNIKNSPHKSMDNSKIIFAGHSMGASAAIAASRNFSLTSAVVAFTPCVYYDKNFGGLPKPTLLLEAGSYTVDGRDLSSVCGWRYRFDNIKYNSNSRSIYGMHSQSNHKTPSSPGVFSNFLTDYLDCYLKGKNNKCSGLRRSSGWSIR